MGGLVSAQVFVVVLHILHIHITICSKKQKDTFSFDIRVGWCLSNMQCPNYLFIIFVFLFLNLRFIILHHKVTIVS